MMKKHKFIPLFFTTIFLLSACHSPETYGDIIDWNNIFGCDFSQVKDAFQWSIDESQRQELSTASNQLEELQGYSVELENVTFLGENASRVYLQFLGKSPETAGLTLIYAEYSEKQKMDQVEKNMTDIWGKSKQQMYCSWPGRVYWMDRWAGGTEYNQVDSYMQSATEDKIMWGSKADIEDALKDYVNPKEIYESWSSYSRIYAQSLKNNWEQVKKEPLVTGVMFKNSSEYETKNVVILDGFNLCMSKMPKDN